MKSESVDFQSSVTQHIRDFLAHKRALKRRFDTEERALLLLDRYALEMQLTDIAAISPEVIEKFMASRPRTRPRSYNHLLGVLRRFFDWMVVQEVLACSPVRTRPRRSTATRIPYIFDLPSARRLLRAAESLPDNPRAIQRGVVYRMIFALLYGLGLRVGEVSRLRREDVDLHRRLLVIRQTKFLKSRLVPFGPRMAEALQEYLRCRQECVGLMQPCTPMFAFSGNTPIHPGTISQTFHKLVPQLHLNVCPGNASPCVHHLRHSFAVGTLLRWYREGINPQDRLLQLSTFLGHVDPASTAVYLTITGDLLQEAGRRFESFASPIACTEKSQ